MCRQSLEVWIRQFHIGGDNKAKRSFSNLFFHFTLGKLDCNKKHEHCFEANGTALQTEYGPISRRRRSGTFYGKNYQTQLHLLQRERAFPFLTALMKHSFSETQNSFPDRTAPSIRKHVAAIHQCKHYRRCYRGHPKIHSRSKQSHESGLMLQVLQSL